MRLRRVPHLTRLAGFSSRRRRLQSAAGTLRAVVPPPIVEAVHGPQVAKRVGGGVLPDRRSRAAPRRPCGRDAWRALARRAGPRNAEARRRPRSPRRRRRRATSPTRSSSRWRCAARARRRRSRRSSTRSAATSRACATRWLMVGTSIDHGITYEVCVRFGREVLVAKAAPTNLHPAGAHVPVVPAAVAAQPDARRGIAPRPHCARVSARCQPVRHASVRGGQARKRPRWRAEQRHEGDFVVVPVE